MTHFPSVFTAALVAAFVGYGASVAIILAAAQALGATDAQTAAWVAAVSIAAAMLAGVLLPFCMAVADNVSAAPLLVVPIVAAFLLVRLIAPIYAATVAFELGLARGVFDTA